MPSVISRLLIIFVVTFSCLAYAGTTAVTASITQLICIAVLTSWLLSTLFKQKVSFIKAGFLLFMASFLVLVAIQLVPLPLALLRIISYKTFVIYTEFLPSTIQQLFAPLTIYPYATIFEFLNVFILFGLFFFVLNSLNTRKDFSVIINAVIILGSFISIFCIFQKYTGAARIYWLDPAGSAPLASGPFANRNNFAGYINMIIPLSLGYLLVDTSLSRKIMYGFSAGVMSLALFMTTSRAGILVYFATLTFFLLAARLREDVRSKSKIVWLIILIFAGMFFLLVDFKTVGTRMLTLFNGKELAVLGHGYSWLDILRIFSDFPFFGTGLATFGAISSMYNSQPNLALFTFAHNDYLQLLSETGLFGFIVIFSMFVFFFKSFFSKWLNRHNEYAVYLSLGGATALFSMLAYSLLDFNLHIPATAVLFFVIMGFTYKLVSFSFNKHSMHNRAANSSGGGGYSLDLFNKGLTPLVSVVSAALVLMVAFTSIFLITKRLTSENNIILGRQYLDRARGASKEAIFDKATFYQSALKYTKQGFVDEPLNAQGYFQYAQISQEISDDSELRDLVAAGNSSEFADNRIDFKALAQKYYIDASLREPTNSYYHLKLGLLFASDSLSPLALKEMHKAEILNPNSIVIRIELCKFFLAMNNYDEYVHNLSRVVSLYKQAALKGGGGPSAEMVETFLKEVNQENLIN